MSERKEETVVKVEKRSGSEVRASVTENGKTGKAEGKDAAEAISDAKNKAGG
jgi:hypothetical protein